MRQNNHDGETSVGPKPRKSREREIFGLFVIMILLAVLLIAITIGFGIQMENKNTQKQSHVKKLKLTGQETTYSRPRRQSCRSSKQMYRDCKDALHQGYKFSGLVSIKPNAFTTEFQVYCDMEADGGGWTLVASIHEDSITLKCTYGDKWSTNDRTPGSQNWFNLLTFGDLFDVTGADYKSKAMYTAQASDIMIWHVPNNLPLNQISNQAFFKYYTTSGFLSKYGSNLQKLFTEYYPMNRIFPTNLADELMTCVEEETWSLLWGSTYSRGTRLPSFAIGNNDLIQVKVNSGRFFDITTSKDYKLNDHVSVMAKVVTIQSKHISLLWIPQAGRATDIHVKVNWKDFGLNVNLIKGSTYYLGYKIRYAAFCGNTMCKALFHFTNARKWGESSYAGTEEITFNRNGTEINMKIKNKIQSTLVGYTVFRKKYTRLPDRSRWSNSFQDLSKCFDTFVSKGLDNAPSLSEKATFVKGEMNHNLADVTPGYIEFRKYDSYGYPYPLCPGIRLLNDTDPALHCIGGVRSGSTRNSRRQCGDFSAWNDLAAHSIERAITATGKKVTDLTSSILIFYR